LGTSVRPCEAPIPDCRSVLTQKRCIEVWTSRSTRDLVHSIVSARHPETSRSIAWSRMPTSTRLPGYRSRSPRSTTLFRWSAQRAGW